MWQLIKQFAERPVCPLLVVAAAWGLGEGCSAEESTFTSSEAAIVCAAKEPVDLIRLLADERFVMRACAEARLHQLLHDQQDRDPNEIERLCLNTYKTTDDPEVRMRVRAVLVDYATLMWSPEPFLGVGTKETTEFDDSGKLNTWLEVTKVLFGGPAAKAGLRVGDRIETVSKTPFKQGKAGSQLDARIAGMQPGQSVVLGVTRDDRRLQVTVKLARKPRSLNRPAEGVQPTTDEECLRQYLNAAGG